MTYIICSVAVERTYRGESRIASLPIDLLGQLPRVVVPYRSNKPLEHLREVRQDNGFKLWVHTDDAHGAVSYKVEQGEDGGVQR